MAKVGKRKIWYCEAKFKDSKEGVCGMAEFPTKKLAEENFRRMMNNKYGNRKYKIVQFWRLPEEMEIEEV
jgi:hypothetical protein